MRKIEVKMPEEYKGKVTASGGYTKTAPREWTEKEIDWITTLKEKGYTARQIAESMDRSPVSVSIKLKRLTKRDNTYNATHLEQKIMKNREFLAAIKPRTILDLYCGSNKAYSTYFDMNPKIKGQLITNDIDYTKPATYHEKRKCLYISFIMRATNMIILI